MLSTISHQTSVYKTSLTGKELALLLLPPQKEWKEKKRQVAWTKFSGSLLAVTKLERHIQNGEFPS